MSAGVTPYSLKDAPALIEHLLPVQKLSAEAYKEQMAGSGKTLTALGSYWKGRKPLILAKACVLGCLLPATGDPGRDLEVFELLMGMDDESFAARWKRRPKPREILGKLSIERIRDYFTVDPDDALPVSAPLSEYFPELQRVRIAWRKDLPELERRRLEARMLPAVPYRERVNQAHRPEEIGDEVHEHVWDAVNAHLGTSASSFPELVEQLGVMRFGHRPRVADTFCGSGQIPFEAARLGCDVYASDLNPIACMLTWGAFNIVGGSPESRRQLARDQAELVERVQREIDDLGIERGSDEWRAKVYLYCLEVRCPQTGWLVPLLPTLVVSKGYRVVAELIPVAKEKRYRIAIHSGVSPDQLTAAAVGTVRSGGRGQDPYLVHRVGGQEHRTKISTLRGDFRRSDGTTGNRLRLWERHDFKPRPDDIFQERLYCVQWMRPKCDRGDEFAHLRGYDYEFRAVTEDDLRRERCVEGYLAEHLEQWQACGWIPDMRIESGAKTDEPIRTRGWTHWHHLWTPRHLVSLSHIRRAICTGGMALLYSGMLDFSSRLSRWETTSARIARDGTGRQVGGASNNSKNVFYNQALNALFNYACRSTVDLLAAASKPMAHVALETTAVVHSCSASEFAYDTEIAISDPPYGDAVNYHEILEFFIAWLRRNPPPEFAEWTWDSRRSLAIRGDGEDFRRGMIAAYKRMGECMPDDGIQVVMFTHQSGALWTDMASIVWAAGLRVTAAWYVATETDSALREGSYVKGTVLLVLRKRLEDRKITRDVLAFDLAEEVQRQVDDLTGLNQQARGLYRDENVFEDADIQMAGYAAALRVLTGYSIIDGRDMAAEALRPRVKGEATFVDGLIDFAVQTANQCLVPQGLQKGLWASLAPAERFYLKMLELEARGVRTLDNFQNFAKAFKVRDFQALLSSRRANDARLKSAVELARSEMSEGSELHGTVLRAVLYAMMELAQEVDGTEVLAHLTHNVPDYYSNSGRRALAIELAGYMAKRLETIREEEASAARVLRELIQNHRVG